MMLLANAYNDVMFALMCPQAHIIAEGNIISVSVIICPKGDTSFQKSHILHNSSLAVQ